LENGVSRIVIIAYVSCSSPLNFLSMLSIRYCCQGDQTVQAYSNFGLISALYASSFMCADETLIFLRNRPNVLFAFAIFSLIIMLVPFKV